MNRRGVLRHNQRHHFPIHAAVFFEIIKGVPKNLGEYPTATMRLRRIPVPQHKGIAESELSQKQNMPTSAHPANQFSFKKCAVSEIVRSDHFAFNRKLPQAGGGSGTSLMSMLNTR